MEHPVARVLLHLKKDNIPYHNDKINLLILSIQVITTTSLAHLSTINREKFHQIKHGQNGHVVFGGIFARNIVQQWAWQCRCYYLIRWNQIGLCICRGIGVDVEALTTPATTIAVITGVIHLSH